MTIDFDKQVKKAAVVFEKRGLTGIQCQVKLAIDYSGSMNQLYANHTVQKVVERILAAAMNVDKDGSVDVWAFNNDSIPLATVTRPLIEGYVYRELIKKHRMGGTSYAPVMSDILSESFSQKKTPTIKKSFMDKFLFKKPANEPDAEPTSAPSDPVLVVFITDGQSDDEHQAQLLIKQTQDKNIYWQLVGIGNYSFKFLEAMADLYPNCGFVAINNIEKISDDDLFEGIVNEEFAAWIKNFS